MVVIWLNQFECLSWCDRPDPQRLGPPKVIDVVSDDERNSCRCRQLDDKIVVRIWQKGPPCVKNLLWMRNFAQDIDNHLNLFRGERRHKAWAQGDRFILNRKCHGKGDPDVSTANRLQNREARAKLRAKSRYQNTCVDDRIHGGIMDDTAGFARNIFGD